MEAGLLVPGNRKWERSFSEDAPTFLLRSSKTSATLKLS